LYQRSAEGVGTHGFKESLSVEHGRLPETGARRSRLSERWYLRPSKAIRTGAINIETA
jgi:hypothetical protein